MKHQLLLLSIICAISAIASQAMEKKRTHDEFMRTKEAAAAQEAQPAQPQPAVPAAVAVPLSAGEATKKEREEKVKESADAQSKIAPTALEIQQAGIKEQQPIDFKEIVIVGTDGKEDKFDATTIETFSGSEFKDLIKEKLADRIPLYILVRVITQAGDKKFVHYFDAHQFNAWHFAEQGKKKTYPLEINLSNKILKNRSHRNIINKIPLTSKNITYFCNSHQNPVKFTHLCSHEQFFLSRDNNRRDLLHAMLMVNQNKDLPLRAQQQYHYGIMLCFGKSGRQDDQAAFTSFSSIDLTQLSPPMQAEVQCKRGYCYLFGKGVPQDINQASALFSAIDLTQAEPPIQAAVRCGINFRFLFEKNVKQDAALAYTLFHAITPTGLPPDITAEAQYIFGCYFLDIHRNAKQAFALLSATNLAQLPPFSKANAQYRLGNLYWSGCSQGYQDFIPQNLAQAFDSLIHCDPTYLSPEKQLTRNRILLHCIVDHENELKHERQCILKFLSTLNISKLDKYNQNAARLYLVSLQLKNPEPSYDIILQHMNVLSLNYLSNEDRGKIPALIKTICSHNTSDPLWPSKLFITLQKFKEAPHLFSEQEFAELQCKLGLLLIAPQIFNKDYKQAFAVLSTIDLALIAPPFRAEVQYNLGTMHQRGLGTHKNHPAAIQCFIYALRNGSEAIKDLVEAQLLQIFLKGQSQNTNKPEEKKQ